MDLGEEAGGGEATVACEGVGHAGGGGHYACRCEEEADEGEAVEGLVLLHLEKLGKTYIRRQMDPALLPVAL